MNNKPDLRLQFDPEQNLTEAVTANRSWLPPNVPRNAVIPHSCWLTRGARGISWHRSGRASRESLQ